MGLFWRQKKSSRKNAEPVRPFCSAVVPAAGSALRMEGAGKILAEIGGLPVLGHTLLALESCPDIDEIVVAARPEDIILIADVCKALGLDKVTHIVKGGATRAQSVLLALQMCRPEAQIAAIHDGARPCVTAGLCSRVIQTAAQCGAAAPGVPLSDTVKAVDAQGLILRTVDRAGLVAIQTPQCFDIHLIKGALHKALADGAILTDDCAAVERLGMTVRVVSGETQNIKITTPGDLPTAAAILIGREGFR